MPEFIHQLLGFGGTGFAVTLAVLALFWKADEAFSDEFREALSKKLQGMKVETESVNWPQSFARVFDHVFGERHLTWRCLFRSCLASALAVLSLLLIQYSLHPWEVVKLSADDVGGLLLAAVCFNFLPDFVSLLETRLVLRFVADRRPTPHTILFMIIIDLVSTIAIFIILGICATLGLVAMYVFLNEESLNLSALSVDYFEMAAKFLTQIWNTGIYLEPGVAGYASIGVFLYSTLFTSAWLWLFLIGWGFVRYGTGVQRVLGALQFALPIKTKPIRAIGEVAAVTTAIAFVVLGILGFDVGPAEEAAVGMLTVGGP